MTTGTNTNKANRRILAASNAERRLVRVRQRGFLMLLALVFGAVFLTVLGALSSMTLVQNRVQNASTGRVRALALAEAGLEYYRWYLAHNPGDLTHGTGAAGPYAIAYNDPEGGVAGEFSLDISGTSYCGQPAASIDIASTGRPDDGSHVSRTIHGRYAQPTVALYSYILNDSVWAGPDRIINGPYHSNGGIRMDGTANAPVTSSLETWNCTSSYGCDGPANGNPAPGNKTGVFGTGPNSNLWSYPVPQVNFAGILADFSNLKTIAQTNGRYLPRHSSGNSSSASYRLGYRLTFNANANGTVTVRRVTSTTLLYVTPVNTADPTTDYSLSGSENAYATYTLSANCGLIFVEDNVWLEGVITGKVTVVAANVTTTGVSPSVVLKNNLTYANDSAGLTVIADHNILVAPDSPQNMTLNGVFIAQGGAFGRNLYFTNSNRNVYHSSYEPRGTLTIHGTTVSNKRTGTRWCNASTCPGGYQVRIDAYDRALATDPPPFTPIVSSDYAFVDWQEE